MHKGIIISNTSPIIVLSAVDKLLLLKELYGFIYIPQAVFDEISEKPNSKAAVKLLEYSDWIIVKTVSNKSAKQFYNTSLHAGEVEVMILAQEINADRVILDDKLARKHAKYLGLNITGTVGILIKAKNEGSLDCVKDVLDAMIAEGIYISNDIYFKALRAANE